MGLFSPLITSVCSVYPLTQLSTAVREWTSLLLLHYCVYAADDTRSLRWQRPLAKEEVISTKSLRGNTSARTDGFLKRFFAESRANPCEQLIGRSVNDDFLQAIYPAEFASFRLPVNPLLLEIVTTRPGFYRCIYAGEDPSILRDMTSNPSSRFLSNVSPSSPLAEQVPWTCCSPAFITHLREKFNRSQLFAMEASLYRTVSLPRGDHPVSNFTLIQGPPGTGKTRTLLTLLNVLQNQQFDLYYETLRRFVNDVLFSSKNDFFSSIDRLNQARIQMKEQFVKPRILVCTPSNAAVNTIIDGIIADGFIDNAGLRYNPSILRLGSGTSPAHWSVSMEYIIDVVIARHCNVESEERGGEGD